MKIDPRFNLRSFFLAAAFLMGLGWGTATSAQQYYLIDLNSRTATDLGTLGGHSREATAINDAGQVVGWSSTNEGLRHAFITGPGGVGVRDLHTFGGAYSSIALDINNVGQVVGGFYPADDPLAFFTHAFITGPNGVGMKELGSLGGDLGHATSINNAGQVGGGSATSNRNFHAFITSADGIGMRDLGTLGGSESYAQDINDVGQATGYSFTSEGVHAFITGPDGVGMRDLGTLGGNYSRAYGINEAGQVFGEAASADGDHHAFITGPDGMGMRNLDPGIARRFVADINDAGQVVGGFYIDENHETTHAFITDPDGADMTDLNGLVDLPEGVILTAAVGINNAGQVIAVAVVPELESYALLLAGLGLIGFIVRRKKTKNLI